MDALMLGILVLILVIHITLTWRYREEVKAYQKNVRELVKLSTQDYTDKLKLQLDTQDAEKELETHRKQLNDHDNWLSDLQYLTNTIAQYSGLIIRSGLRVEKSPTRKEHTNAHRNTRRRKANS